MKQRVLAILLSLAMVLAMAPVAASAAEPAAFNDVRSSDWFYNDVQYAYEKGIMNGTGNGNFSPQDRTTRGMVVTVLYRMTGASPTGNKGTFKDVPAGQWYSDAVEWAAANGVVNGMGNNTFEPNTYISRAQMATILYRYSQFKEYDTAKSNDLSGYEDLADLGSWAEAAMKWANAEGLINGVSASKLDPKGSATRAQVAAILHRFCEAHKDSDTGNALDLGAFKVGDYVTFGHYEQDNDTANGKEAIEWLVLDKKDGSALVISRYGLDWQEYYDGSKAATWENSTLRTWLNDDFLEEAFSSSERKAILTTEVSTPNNPNFRTYGGNDTKDNIFLLSLQEMEQYFSLSSSWTDYDGNKYNLSGVDYGTGGYKTVITSATAYAAAKQGVNEDALYHDAEGNASCRWWLRSPGGNRSSACNVAEYGLVHAIGLPADVGCMVRPALRINFVYNNEELDSTIDPQKVKPGDYVTFGHYEQDNDTVNGKEAIEWKVLDKKDGRILVISKYGLDCQMYHDTYTSVTWETCDLRKWLNTTFLEEAFSSSEKSAIPAVTLSNPDNPIHGTDGGKDTQDKVFVLSLQELQQYFDISNAWTDYDENSFTVEEGDEWNFGGAREIITSPTAYAAEQGVYHRSGNHDAEGKGSCWWWLRSPGIDNNNALAVSDNGFAVVYGHAVYYSYNAVRPALWITLSS